MTATQARRSPPTTAPIRETRPRPEALRLARLHLVSRRVPAAMAALAACAVVLRVVLQAHWIKGGGAGAQQLPLVIETGSATIIAVTTRSPFSEPERATGRWLPYLRLATAIALTAAAVGALAAGAAAARLPGGNLDLARDVAGVAGIGLLSAAVLGGALAWIGPMTYLVIAEYALGVAWRTPWTWPARPPHDHGAALCAALVFTVGTAIITMRGARDSVRE